MAVLTDRTDGMDRTDTEFPIPRISGVMCHGPSKINEMSCLSHIFYTSTTCILHDGKVKLNVPLYYDILMFDIKKNPLRQKFVNVMLISAT